MSHELESVFFTRNSHVAGTGADGSGPAAASASAASPFLPLAAGLGSSPEGALAMARMAGLASAS